MSFVSKYKLYSLIPIVFLGILFLSATSDSIETKAPKITRINKSNFDQYWYQGKAEITSYNLKQARYGEIRNGTAVLVFVTEPFSKSKQVKLNTTDRNQEDVVSVLKLNLSKKFVTGIYDYSILQSIFTPVQLDKYEHSIKVTTSIQEWCGHTFTQLNLQKYKYRISLHSYFETEGDQEYQVEQAMLEDEIWNLIRIAPSALPTGSIQLIPNTATARLRHSAIDVEEAVATLIPHETNKKLNSYQLNFPLSQRTIRIDYHKKFPHEIEGWKETYIDNGKELSTTATRTRTILSDYWNKHQIKDESIRKELGLDQ
ncbi:hypothetical protein [Aureispira anguillae]|uniref:Septum formation inhibitor Maf n=1 Tax=Aureispira anguillae TaxID=2864201 RepID=A0A915YJT3_9BACT|nr:hypothetical protein [Aureispira anguillae]BDS14540.1 hypothetical protein AsAng_0053200 [Aureispira anguillae]